MHVLNSYLKICERIEKLSKAADFCNSICKTNHVWMTPLHGEGHNKPDEQTGRTRGSLISLAGFHTSITLVGCERTEAFLWVRLRLSGPASLHQAFQRLGVGF